MNSKKQKLRFALMVQQSHFADELTHLKSGKLCSLRIQHLSPFIDEKGLIRVCGRLKNSNLANSEKYPIILSKEHHVHLLVDFYHTKYLHNGPQILQATISRYIRFLAPLTRFVSRRGICENLYCDNGTNCIEASSEIKKIIKTFFKDQNKKSTDLPIDMKLNFIFYLQLHLKRAVQSKL